MIPVLNKVHETVLNENMITNGDNVLVAFSGGADSLFLILSLIELKKTLNFNIYAAHLNHGIRGVESDSDERFVIDFCNRHNIKLYLKTVDIPSVSKELKISEETAGRNERYKFFNEVCQKNGFNKIAVAHNMNDSVETVILNIIRGSSLKGLCGIKSVNGNVIRPIISISRDEIEEYLNSINQPFCIDSTNNKDIYTRNKIRNVILKDMSQINDSVIKTIYSNLENLKDDEDFLNKYANSTDCISQKNDTVIINKKKFSSQHDAIKKRIILNCFNILNGNCNNISGAHISILLDVNHSGKTYNMPGGIIVTVSFDKIIFSKQKDKTSEFYFEYKPCQSLEFLPNVYLKSSYCNDFVSGDKTSVYIDADKLKNQILTVRSKSDGDKFIPYGMKSHKKLKQFFIEQKIPEYKRNEIPIILDGTDIVAAIPYRISDNYKITDKTKRILKIQITKEK